MTKETRKKLIIIHGWEGSPTGGWFPWLKSAMEKRGWEVLVPAMPNTNNPELFEWLAFLKQIVGEVNENTFMVGHSLGCITILRFLESLSAKEQIGGAVLVAGFDNPLKYKELKNFFQEPINWQGVKARCKKFVAVHSMDDPLVPVENGLRFKGQLGAKIITLGGFRHFSGDEGVYELPIVAQELVRISGQALADQKVA